jgi:hypothetical protein
VTQPLHTSQLLKPGKHKYRVQTKAHAHPETLEAREEPRRQLVTQLLTDQNTQGEPKHQTLDKVQKYYSFNSAVWLFCSAVRLTVRAQEQEARN